MVVKDSHNNGILRREVIDVICQLASCTSKQADNYYTNACKQQNFKYLKNHGKVYSAQKTTTSQTQVTMEQQHRWHSAVDFCWEKQREMNLPKTEFVKKHAFFQLNLNEESVTGSDGTIKVVASIFGKKVQKNMEDFKGSISIIRVGSAAGIEGPIIFLCALKDKKHLPANLQGDLSRHKHFNLPKGSKVICTPTAYLTDDAWLEAVPEICNGIRHMEGIKEHKDWWVCLSCDGFGSHLFAEAYPILTKYLIMFLLEDGDTSQTNQAFDQMKAKEDKRNIRSLLDTQRRTSKLMNDQWTLIYACMAALQNSTSQAWIDSFKRVNLHPDLE